MKDNKKIIPAEHLSEVEFAAREKDTFKIGSRVKDGIISWLDKRMSFQNTPHHEDGETCKDIKKEILIGVSIIAFLAALTTLMVKNDTPVIENIPSKASIAQNSTTKGTSINTAKAEPLKAPDITKTPEATKATKAAKASPIKNTHYIQLIAYRSKKKALSFAKMANQKDKSHKFIVTKKGRYYLVVTNVHGDIKTQQKTINKKLRVRSLLVRGVRKSI